jgi:hypothetical protein
MVTELENPLNQPISLDLTAGEVNYLLHALGQRPFAEVANLIGKIKAQGDVQFVPPPPPAEASADAAVN